MTTPALVLPATWRIEIAENGQVFRCAGDRSLLAGMECLGRADLPVGCRNGGCGVCKVRILEGTWQARVMSREHVSEEDERAGTVLACRVRPTSDMRISVTGWKRVGGPHQTDADAAIRAARQERGG